MKFEVLQQLDPLLMEMKDAVQSQENWSAL